MTETLGVVHGPRASANLMTLFDLQQRTGVRIVILFTAETASSCPALTDVSRGLFDTRILSGAPGSQLTGLDFVTTFVDDQLEVADELTAELGLPRSVPGTWDKAVQRQLLAEHGLTGLKSAAGTGAENLRAAVGRVGFPAVAKPSRAAGGKDVHFLRTEADVCALLRAARETPTLRWQVESEIRPCPSHPDFSWLGPLASVEVTSDSGGGHKVEAVFGKTPLQQVAVRRDSQQLTVRVSGDVHPSGFSPALEAELVDLVANCLDVLQVRSRLTHTEVLLTPQGLEVVEINGRLGGYLSRLTDRTSSVDLLAAHIRAVLGRPVPSTARKTSAVALGWFPSFGCLDGTVRSIGSRKRLLELPGLVQVDDLALQGDSFAVRDARLASVAMTADSFPQLEARFGAVGRELSAMYERDGGPAPVWGSEV